MNIYRLKARLISGLLALAFMVLSGVGNMITYAAETEGLDEVIELRKTDMKVYGATLWPSIDTQMLDRNGNLICTLSAGTPVRALSISGNTFKIYYNKKVGYIDATYTMINLPDVMQEEMLYNITNSYSSIYKIDGDAIDNVTGEVLYPYVKTDEDTYLVPLLYTVALNLYEAEKMAIDKGYTIKVYDAYRPYSVTQYIYQQTSAFVEENPEYNEFINGVVGGVKYSQSFFLAKSASNHNYGVALDITLCDLETEEELTMQSDMHELSIHSVVSLNTEAANILRNIMVSNGFGTLSSEWWHFEIRDARNKVATFQAKPYERK